MNGITVMFTSKGTHYIIPGHEIERIESYKGKGGYRIQVNTSTGSLVAVSGVSQEHVKKFGVSFACSMRNGEKVFDFDLL